MIEPGSQRHAIAMSALTQQHRAVVANDILGGVVRISVDDEDLVGDFELLECRGELGQKDLKVRGLVQRGNDDGELTALGCPRFLVDDDFLSRAQSVRSIAAGVGLIDCTAAILSEYRFDSKDLLCNAPARNRANLQSSESRVSPEPTCASAATMRSDPIDRGLGTCARRGRKLRNAR